MKTVIYQNLTYKIGENREDNDQLVRTSEKTWWWFHLEHQPSCHVVLTHSLIEIDKSEQRKAIKHGCVLCKQNSKTIQHIPISIMYSQLENIIPTNIIGTVDVKKYKTICL